MHVRVCVLHFTDTSFNEKQKFWSTNLGQSSAERDCSTCSFFLCWSLAQYFFRGETVSLSLSVSLSISDLWNCVTISITITISHYQTRTDIVEFFPPRLDGVTTGQRRRRRRRRSTTVETIWLSLSVSLQSFFTSSTVSLSTNPKGIQSGWIDVMSIISTASLVYSCHTS